LRITITRIECLAALQSGNTSIWAGCRTNTIGPAFSCKYPRTRTDFPASLSNAASPPKYRRLAAVISIVTSLRHCLPKSM
jgi:hypothetical protein